MTSSLYRIIDRLFSQTLMPGDKLYYSQAACLESTQPSERCVIGDVPMDTTIPHSLQINILYRNACCVSDNLVRHGDSLNDGASSGRRQDQAGSAER